MRLIDADALLEILKREEAYNSDIPQRADGNRDAIMDVLSAQTIDAVPVIRCKVCYHRILRPKTCMPFCKFHWIYVRPEEFCNHGAKNETN